MSKVEKRIKTISDELESLIAEAKKNESVFKVKGAVIDSRYWMLAYKHIDQHKEELEDLGYYPDLKDCVHWIDEVDFTSVWLRNTLENFKCMRENTPPKSRVINKRNERWSFSA